MKIIKTFLHWLAVPYHNINQEIVILQTFHVNFQIACSAEKNMIERRQGIEKKWDSRRRKRKKRNIEKKEEEKGKRKRKRKQKQR